MRSNVPFTSSWFVLHKNSLKWLYLLECFLKNCKKRHRQATDREIFGKSHYLGRRLLTVDRFQFVEQSEKQISCWIDWHQWHLKNLGADKIDNYIMYMLKTLTLDKNVTKKSGDQYSGLTAINKNTRAHSDLISPSPLSRRVAISNKTSRVCLTRTICDWLTPTQKTRNITDFNFPIMEGILDAEFFQ